MRRMIAVIALAAALIMVESACCEIVFLRGGAATLETSLQNIWITDQNVLVKDIMPIDSAVTANKGENTSYAEPTLIDALNHFGVTQVTRMTRPDSLTGPLGNIDLSYLDHWY